MARHNNQPRVGGSGRWDVMTERVGGGARGGHRPIVWGSELSDEKKNGMDLNARCTMNIHNNQQKKGSCDGGDDGGQVRQAGHAGEAQYHRFGGVVS